MTERNDHEPLDTTIRDALRSAREARAAPPFEAVWAAADEQARRTRRRRVALRSWPGRRRWAPLAAALVAFAAVLLLPIRGPEPPDAAHPLPADPARAGTHPAQPLIWYAPTDELLEVSSLRYAAQPAALTYYDPIHLEMRP